jgi:hypothetical protein
MIRGVAKGMVLGVFLFLGENKETNTQRGVGARNYREKKCYVRDRQSESKREREGFGIVSEQEKRKRRDGT